MEANIIPSGSHSEMYEMAKLPLDNESVVFIVGSYEGVTAEVLDKLFSPKLFCFEPQLRMAEATRQRVPNAQVFNFGLGDKGGEFPMINIGNDCCSFLGGEVERGERGMGELVDVVEFLEEHSIQRIDLFHINCEGYEFPLLSYMVKKGLISRIQYLLVQFHRAPKESVIYEGLHSDLLEEFDLIWKAGGVIPVWSIYQSKGGEIQ